MWKNLEAEIMTKMKNLLLKLKLINKSVLLFLLLVVILIEL